MLRFARNDNAIVMLFRNRSASEPFAREQNWFTSQSKLDWDSIWHLDVIVSKGNMLICRVSLQRAEEIFKKMLDKCSPGDYFCG